MAITYPLFCASHTVRGACTVGIVRGTGANSTITVPEGVYWSDPLTAGHGTDLLTKVKTLVDAVDGGSYYMAAQYSGPVVGDGFYLTYWEATGGGAGKFRPAGANTEGLRVYQRLGVSRTRNSTLFANQLFGGYPYGVWTPGNRAELMPSWAHTQDNNAASSASWGGRAWAYSTGEPTKRRLVELNQVNRAYVKPEDGVVSGLESGDSDQTFETLLWPYLARGEMVRVYSDRDATTTYLTADCSASATTVSVASGTGILDDAVFWLDGERMSVVSGGGTATLTVERPDAWAHDAGAPVSLGHVATYMLDSDGGDVSMGGFTSQRRGSNQTRYDMAIALVQTKFVED